MHHPPRLIASDLDGTLLAPDHQASAYTRAVLHALVARGVILVLATGRHFVDVSGIAAALGVPAYLITSNGARVHTPQQQKLHASDLPPQLVSELLAEHWVHGCASVSVYRDHDWLIDRDSPDLLRYFRDSGFGYRVADLARHTTGINKLLYVGREAHLQQLQQRLQQRFGDTLYITFSANECLEVMAAGVSKGSALDHLLRHLGLTRQDAMAFGDGPNDVDLLTTAARGFRMQNAHPALVAATPHLPMIGGNHESAVARTLATCFGLTVDIPAPDCETLAPAHPHPARAPSP